MQIVAAISSIWPSLLVVMSSMAVDARTRTEAVCDAGMSEADRALIQEAFHLQDRLGRQLWAQWTPHRVPFLFKRHDCDFLIGHPAPPPDFEPSTMTPLGRALWHRPNRDTVAYQAAFIINGFFTAVMTTPAEGESPHGWVLKAVHELFHIFQYEQRPERLVNPFVGPHVGDQELSYPFPFEDDAIKSWMRIEAEEVFRPISGSASGDQPARMAARVLQHVRQLAPHVFRDSLDLRYKQWMEWHEGIAMYTERELARRAARSAGYAASPPFARRYGASGYAVVWKGTYADALNPIRFVGEGVEGRIQFYYLGMGKAYLLDALHPRWRQRYFLHTLDELLRP